MEDNHVSVKQITPQLSQRLIQRSVYLIKLSR